MNEKILELSDFLERKARLEAECFPIDRYFLRPYLREITSLNPIDFILCNLNRGSNTYTVQLLLCLPELWAGIDINEILLMARKFTNIFSYYTLIEFTYKYVEIDLIELFFKMNWIEGDAKSNIADYLVNSLYFNLIKSDGDFFFFEKLLYGVSLDDWTYLKQRLLIDKRTKPALREIHELFQYLNKLRIQLQLSQLG